MTTLLLMNRCCSPRGMVVVSTSPKDLKTNLSRDKSLDLQSVYIYIYRPTILVIIVYGQAARFRQTFVRFYNLRFDGPSYRTQHMGCYYASHDRVSYGNRRMGPQLVSRRSRSRSRTSNIGNRVVLNYTFNITGVCCDCGRIRQLPGLPAGNPFRVIRVFS